MSLSKYRIYYTSSDHVSECRDDDHYAEFKADSPRSAQDQFWDALDRVMDCDIAITSVEPVIDDNEE